MVERPRATPSRVSGQLRIHASERGLPSAWLLQARQLLMWRRSGERSNGCDCSESGKSEACVVGPLWVDDGRSPFSVPLAMRDFDYPNLTKHNVTGCHGEGQLHPLTISGADSALGVIVRIYVAWGSRAGLRIRPSGHPRTPQFGFAGVTSTTWS